MRDTKHTITVYWSNRMPTSQYQEDDYAGGWWWCVLGFDPEGPFDTEVAAMESFVENAKRNGQ